ncbi:MAG: phosphohydrolase, partial [Flavobacteriales bacterium]|nr:phosphohydrolase [Flavobacteriales bacterium]
LATMILNRRLFKIELQPVAFGADRIESETRRVMEKLGISRDEAVHFVIHDKVDNRAYNQLTDNIRIKRKDGSIQDAAMVSDHLNIAVLNQKVEKYFLAVAE